jgi:hypothetical protein
MPGRDRVMRFLLAIYAAGTILVAMPFALALSNVGNLAETTSGRVLAGALLALGFGSLMAARDPWRHRLVIQMLIVFTSLAALSIAARLAFGEHSRDPAWLLLPAAIAMPVLLGCFYPRGPRD